MTVETPRSATVALQQWTSPQIATLRSEDARVLQNTFTSLTQYLNTIRDAITANYYSLAIGTVTSGTASASITGVFPSQLLNLQLQTGPTGSTGPTGATGATGATGTSGYALANLDGGTPSSIYVGIVAINAGTP